GALLLGAAIGVAHGLLVTKLKISFLIVTLGTFAILRSQAQVLLQGQSRSVDIPLLDTLANGRIGPVPNLVIVAVVIYLLATLVLRRTGFGRSLYAVGSIPQAARL